MSRCGSAISSWCAPVKIYPWMVLYVEGNSAVNEAALTGESIPADKAPGDPVSAATLNQSGYLVV